MYLVKLILVLIFSLFGGFTQHSSANSVNSAKTSSQNSDGKSSIQFLFPKKRFGMAFERELKQIVSEFNEINSNTHVDLVFKGNDFSSLKELVAASFTQSTPALSAIELSEIEALHASTKFAKKMSPDFRKRLRNTVPFLNDNAITFQLAVPVLVIDQEMALRAYENPFRPPNTWKALMALAQKFSKTQEIPYPIAMALRGARGLWMLEALSREPLWIRKAGGLKSNRLLEKIIGELKILNLEQLSHEQALTAFVKRKSPLLLTSSDILPYLANSQAKFRWTAVELPVPGLPANLSKKKSILSGSVLVVTRESKAVENFLSYLYSPRVAARWSAAGGSIPLTKKWTKTKEWKASMQIFGPYVKSLEAFKKGSYRTSDPEVMRARTVFEEALTRIFPSDSSKSNGASESNDAEQQSLLTPGDIFRCLDQVLSISGSNLSSAGC